MQFADLLYSLSASFQAGRQMTEALWDGIDNMLLIYPKDARIVVELKWICAELMEHRANEVEVLSDFAIRSENEDIMNFFDIYFTCRSTGGDIQRIIVAASETIIDKFNIEKEIYTKTAQKRYEAKILTLIPALVLLILQLSSPEYTMVLYSCAAGRIIMTIALGIVLLAYYFSIKITDIKV